MEKRYKPELLIFTGGKGAGKTVLIDGLEETYTKMGETFDKTECASEEEINKVWAENKVRTDIDFFIIEYSYDALDMDLGKLDEKPFRLVNAKRFR